MLTCLKEYKVAGFWCVTTISCMTVSKILQLVIPSITSNLTPDVILITHMVSTPSALSILIGTTRLEQRPRNKCCTPSVRVTTYLTHIICVLCIVSTSTLRAVKTIFVSSLKITYLRKSNCQYVGTTISRKLYLCKIIIEFR